MASIKRIGKDSFGVPIWEAVYRRVPGGKQVRRRFHAERKADVERAILLDSNRSDVRLKWSEGAAIYLEAKRLEGKSPASMLLVERAVSVFIEIMGDLEIEKTTPGTMKDFMQNVITRPLTKKSGEVWRLSGPKVANHHRKELLTVARYLRGHTDKVSSIPFEHVPPLPVNVERRRPVDAGQVGAYMDALPPHVRRPVMMVLYYGLRSTAICNLLPTATDAPYLIAFDKGGVERHIPIDGMLRRILQEAEEYRNAFESPASRLFVNDGGRAWDKNTLRRAAQKAWVASGLERKKIHEVRHTLGTLASKNFNARMVQAAMGHRDEKSAAIYFHPDEEMAAEVRQKIITELSQKNDNGHHPVILDAISIDRKADTFSCPHCGRNLRIPKEKGRKPKRLAAL
jgi:integrase